MTESGTKVSSALHNAEYPPPRHCSPIAVLIIFSDPPGKDRLRLDKEDRILVGLSRQFPEFVTVDRLHASEIDDIHNVITKNTYDIIQFSGHGSEEGIFLDKSDMGGNGELVSAERLQSLIGIAEKPPILLILTSCYSNASIPILAEIAPFVITAVGPVEDRACLEFVRGFYERLFSGFSIGSSFEHATSLLKTKNIPHHNFRLDRRCLTQRGKSKFVESIPDARKNSILVNLDAVADCLDKFDMPQEEICHLLARKLKIHYWIFSVPREKCVIPIGRLLFGEFSWNNANDVVYCHKLMRLRADVSQQHWQVWLRLLISYNDLASSDYRILRTPAMPSNRTMLAKATNLFQHYVNRYLIPSRDDILNLGYSECLPHIEFVISHCESAADQLVLERYSHVVRSLEEALTNYHEIVDVLQPPQADL